MKMIKTTVNLSESQTQDIVEMAEARGTTKTEVIRRALKTERFVFNALASGDKILIERSDGNRERLFYPQEI